MYRRTISFTVGKLQGELFSEFHGRLVFCGGLVAGGALLGPTMMYGPPWSNVLRFLSHMRSSHV
jgi:hypothetical protein